MRSATRAAKRHKPKARRDSTALSNSDRAASMRSRLPEASPASHPAAPFAALSHRLLRSIFARGDYDEKLIEHRNFEHTTHFRIHAAENELSLRGFDRFADEQQAPESGAADVFDLLKVDDEVALPGPKAVHDLRRKDLGIG